MHRRFTRACSMALIIGFCAIAQGAAPSRGADLDAIRAALDKYKDPIAAIRDGYFSTMACLDFPGGAAEGTMAYPAGGMGVHFLNMSLVGPQLDSLHPQVLIYEPRGGRLELAAAEWFMPAQLSQTAPQILGRSLEGPMEGHYPVMPVELHHWDLHVWLWKNNPAGTFSPTNPDVHCPDGPYTVHDHPPHMLMNH